MSQTPLTDAYLASRCKGEHKQSWVEFARGLELKLQEQKAEPAETAAEIQERIAELRMEIHRLTQRILGDPLGGYTYKVN